MKFDDVIKSISPIFLEHGFSISDHSRNYIRYESDVVAFTFAFDSIENAFYVAAGYKDRILIELLDNQLMQEVFGAVNYSGQKQLIDEYLVHFLKGRGHELLRDNSAVLDKLEAYSTRRAKEYTESILKQQTLKAADNAWINKDYPSFIKLLDTIDKNTLPESYLKKYRIAVSKNQQKQG